MEGNIFCLISVDWADLGRKKFKGETQQKATTCDQVTVDDKMQETKSEETAETDITLCL